MDWLTRRQALRLYLNYHDWWWKWPFVATAVALWVGALLLLVAPWDRAGSEEHIDGLPAPTATDPKPDDRQTEEGSSWSSRDAESTNGRTAEMTLPTVKAPAESIQPEEEPATADTDATDREAQVAEEARPLESQDGDVAEARDQPPRSSPPTTSPTTTTGPTTTGAPPTTSSPTTTTTTTPAVAASRPTPDTSGPETSTTTTTQPAVAETTTPPTTTKTKGKPGKTDPADDGDLSDTKDSKVRPARKTDKRPD